MTRFRRAALALCILPGLAAAQEDVKSILVLDASGSMWGQIDGVAKIEIAQGVVGDLLATLPESQTLGLSAYGHRTKGDCTDIETLVEPGAAGRDAIAAAVKNLRPRGKTPMTDAVIHAAEALKYTEVPATVILVSDGIETCNPDPCAAARALEEAGVQLTVHVVGFDVDDPEARLQMQCMADETGGQFLLAANATELGEALTQVTQAAASYQTLFVATEGDGGPRIEQPLIWDLKQGEEFIVDLERGASFSRDLTEGEYTVSVLRPSDEASVERVFSVTDADQTIALALPSELPAATVTGPRTAEAGSTVQIDWDGPDAEGDYIAISQPDDSGYVNYAYTRDGSPVSLVMPPEPGNYELRYVLKDGRETLATQPVTVTEAAASLDAQGSAPIGAQIPVTWTGPDYDGDYIAVSEPGDKGYVNYTYTREGAPLDLQMPSEPGTYELRYFMKQDRTVLATRTIEVTALEASLDAAQTAEVGARIPVTWSGPDYDGDYIAVSEPGDKGYVNYTYTREGASLDLLMPSEPGTYELRYFMKQDRTVLATRMIEVTNVTATLDAPATAAAGADIPVGWTGPDYDGDYITVSVPGDKGYVNYTYTREGAPLDLTMPSDPGTYEIRYVMKQDRTVLASQTIEVSDISATLDVVAEARAGAAVLVHWDGPGYDKDYVSVADADMPDKKYHFYTYAREGSPLLLRLPAQPGNYQIRYVAAGDEARVVGTTQITLTEVTASIDAPEQVPAGGILGLSWEGPDYPGDYISLARVGEPDNKYSVFKRTTEDSPMVLKLPEGPGRYELRYVMDQGDTVIHRQPIELTYEPE